MDRNSYLFKKMHFCIILLCLLLPEIAGSQTKILWGIGDNFGGATGSALYQEAQTKILSHWYNGPQDLGWIRGYKNNSTVSNHYGNGLGIQLIVWLAQNRATADYAIGEQFQQDIRELVEIFKGNGPNYGPLYVVLFTELETYPPSEGAEEYKQKLSDAYIKAVDVIHETYDQAQAGLGLGGYSWPQNVPGTRDLSRWEAAIAKSDFTCTQQMQSYKNWSQMPGKFRNSVRQLGKYGKPVMISHFKLWSGGPDDNPDPYDKKVADAQGAFNSFMDDMFTESSLESLYNDGLRAWVWMNDEYIRKHGANDEVFLRAKNFIAAHNEENPLMTRDLPPTLPIENVESLLVYPFDDCTFNPQIADNAPVTASAIQNHYLSFDIFNNVSDSHGENEGKWIRDHGQGPDHINALSENEAINPNSANQKNNYLAFTVTPATGEKLSLSWLTFDIQANTGRPDSPPQLTYYAALYCSKNGFTDRIGEPVAVSANEETSVSGWITSQINLNQLSFSVNEAVEFRIYLWRAGNTNERSERWLELDNIRLYSTTLKQGDAITPVKRQNTLQLYPNPVHDYLIIDGLQGDENLKITGIDGHSVQTGQAAGKQQVTIPVAHLQNGIYLVQTANRQTSQTLKFIINHK